MLHSPEAEFFLFQTDDEGATTRTNTRRATSTAPGPGRHPAEICARSSI
ncbi:MAG: hypothetical protein ACLT5P_16570 [Flavonifractor plautii]